MPTDRHRFPLQKRRSTGRQLASILGIGKAASKHSSRPVAAKGISVVRLSPIVLIALPPLWLCSIQKRAIGFSYPRGAEGKLIAGVLVFLTGVCSIALFRAVGLLAVPLSFWLSGGTALVISYSCLTSGVAFVRDRCSGCRLRPIIEEHEAMHLGGIASEGAVWNETRNRYSCEGLSIEGDPKICSFCPIPVHLRETGH